MPQAREAEPDEDGSQDLPDGTREDGDERDEGDHHEERRPARDRHHQDQDPGRDSERDRQCEWSAPHDLCPLSGHILSIGLASGSARSRRPWAWAACLGLPLTHIFPPSGRAPGRPVRGPARGESGAPGAEPEAAAGPGRHTAIAWVS